MRTKPPEAVELAAADFFDSLLSLPPQLTDDEIIARAIENQSGAVSRQKSEITRFRNVTWVVLRSEAGEDVTAFVYDGDQMREDFEFYKFEVAAKKADDRAADELFLLPIDREELHCRLIDIYEYDFSPEFDEREIDTMADQIAEAWSQARRRQQSPADTAVDLWLWGRAYQAETKGIEKE